MLLLAALAGCQCNGPTTSTTIDVDTGDDGSEYTKKYTTYEESGGSTADTSVPAVCAGTLACWRFELPQQKAGIPDLSGNDNLLTLSGAATSLGPGPMLPGGIPNTGMLSVGGGDDFASVAVEGTNLAEFTAGYTVEALIRSSEKVFAADKDGNRVRTALWLDDDRVSLRVLSDDKGAFSIQGRTNFQGDGADACAVEATGPLSSALQAGACVSMTYDPTGELRVFVNGVEVASNTVGKGCSTPSQVGPAVAGARFQVGADSAIGTGTADHSWRGEIDEVRITTGVVPTEDLTCALASAR